MITKPMLAVAAKDIESIVYPVLATPKLDGIRCLKVNGKALSRKFKDIPNHYIRNWIESNCPNGVDGEILIPNKTFNETQSLVMTEDGQPDFVYFIFDYVKDNLEKPYDQRIKDLKDWLISNKDNSKIICLFPTLITNSFELKQYEKECILNNYEGVMIRSLTSPYKCGRSTLKEGYLLKIKQFEDSEAIIIGFEEKMHNNNELTTNELGYAKRSSHKENMIQSNTLGSLLVKDVNTNVEFSIGTGFNDELRNEIWTNKDKYLNNILTYTYQPSGGKDKPRFPVFKGFRHFNDISN